MPGRRGRVSIGAGTVSAAYPGVNGKIAFVRDVVEETGAAGSSSLSYPPETDRYHYVWKTDASWAGTCRRLAIGLGHGTFHRADFKF